MDNMIGMGFAAFVFSFLAILYSIWLIFWPALIYNRMNKIIKLMEERR